jgi:predicted SnoaL-like aldol condensation-catalyzing enzyme
MSVEQNKAIARRFIEEVWNKGRLEVADELLAPSLVNHQATARPPRDATPSSGTLLNSAPPIRGFPSR